MSFVNSAPVDDVTGRIIAMEGPPESNDPYLAGVRYYDNTTTGSAYVSATPAVLNATFQIGVARDESGILFALVDNPPALADRCYLDGVLVDQDGQICLTTVNDIDAYVHGWPVDSIGQLCITGIGPAPTPNPPNPRVTPEGDSRVTSVGDRRTIV